jgi:hypothetical protein
MKNEPLKSFHSKIFGTFHKNKDGVDRQKILRNCKIGEKLILKHAPSSCDKNAVEVCRATGEQLGYLSGELAKEVVYRLDIGNKVDAEISDLTGGGFFYKKSRRCIIKITKYKLK